MFRFVEGSTILLVCENDGCAARNLEFEEKQLELHRIKDAAQVLVNAMRDEPEDTVRAAVDALYAALNGEDAPTKTFDIVIMSRNNSDGLEIQGMKINGTKVLHVALLCEYPEDAIIERDLVSCEQVTGFMKEVYDAGRRGEKLTIAWERAS